MVQDGLLLAAVEDGIGAPPGGQQVEQSQGAGDGPSRARHRPRTAVTATASVPLGKAPGRSVWTAARIYL
ncbi:hypothetical protein [Streptomyces sp. NPDC002599]|uniref:hypothetical protein n=1 Tax=Streptomyces sp. NPDC002599 TaxID=3154421 RepID=UPI00332C666E